MGCGVCREADPQIFASKDKFIQLGMHCKTIRNSQSAMGAIDRELHEAVIRLLDQASFRCAKALIQEGYDSIETRALDKYTDG
jgi:ferredoxin